ncbi:MAG: hypothetical protein J0M33_04950 [Anaerolineae bacterium]|nr:hypothetical protein [Anaerolineae bacterium]
MEKAKRGELQDSGGRGRFIAAVVLIGLGAYFLLAQFGVVSWDIVGTVFGTLGNLIGMFFGGIGEAIGLVFGTLGSAIGNLWPVLLIALGLLMLWRGRRTTRHS